MKAKVLYIILLLFTVLTLSAQNDIKKKIKLSSLPVKTKLEKLGIYHFSIDSAFVFHNTLIIHINRKFGFQPIRDTLINQVTEAVKISYKKNIGKGGVQLMLQNRLIESYIPHFISQQIDSTSICRIYSPIIIQRLDKSRVYSGLNGRKIALWASHGKYYEINDRQWIWQRSRLFGTVEDLFSTSFVNTYLCPMLENAGAEIYMPRERDRHHIAYIVDNDNHRHHSFKRKGDWEKCDSGYRHMPIINGRENPFREGSYLTTDKWDYDTYAEYTPNITKQGLYAVYISWGKALTNGAKAYYTVNHLGGQTHFKVDQRVDGRTWHYLGSFEFGAGRNRNTGSIRVEAAYDNLPGAVLSTDAIRIGGGMGRVARGEADNATVSGVPAFHEGARYYLQAAGMPDSIYSPENFNDDYRDDFKCRGMWVNHLIHNMNIPIDMAFAFHTDSGISADSTVIGTLTIFNTDYGHETLFSDGSQRLICRELSETIQTQLVNDIRCSVDTTWVRREMWDKPYNEVLKPDVPSLIVELLSHQNLSDMHSGLDPRFRFIAARAIYKGMLRFLSQYSTLPYIVQPLAPRAFQIEQLHDKRIRLSWQPQIDSLEPTALPINYRIYRREDNGSYNNGIIVSNNSSIIDLPEWGKTYHYRITAENGGGESFPSEELSVCLFEQTQAPILIVNGFTRISAPQFMATDSLGGINYCDEGVADGYNLHTIGQQYEYCRNKQWCDNENPGWGATDTCACNYEERGNTFDYVSVHGNAIKACGLSFVSCSRAAFETTVDVNDYSAIDLLMGEQHTTHNLRNESGSFSVFSPAMLKKLKDIRTPIFISGAYIGSDADSLTAMQIANLLHYKTKGSNSALNLEVRSVHSNFNSSFEICTFQNEPTTYRVESPDILIPADSQTKSIFTYGNSNESAGICYEGDIKKVAIGFPFECILKPEIQKQVMRDVLQFLLNNNQE